MENNNKIRDLYSHASSNVISMNALNTISANTMKRSKLGEGSFYDLFSSPALEEKIFSDDIISPICDNSNDACDTLNQPTESIPFKIPMKIVEKITMNVMQGMAQSIQVITC